MQVPKSSKISFANISWGKKANLDPKDAHKESYTKNVIRTKLHRALKQIKLQPSQPYCGLKMRFL